MLKVAEKLLSPLLLLAFPSQLAYHFWPQFSLISQFRIDYLSPTVYFTDLLIICLLLSNFINKKVISFKKINISPAVFMITFLAISNILLSLSPLFTLYKFLRLSEYLLLYRYLVENKKSFLKNFSQILPLTVSWISLLVFWQSYLQHSVGGLWFWLGERNITPVMLNVAKTTVLGSAVFLRPYATFSHPNALAGILCVSLLILVYLRQKHLTSQKFFLIPFTLGTCALILTFSRSAMFIFVVSILLLIKNNKHKLILITSIVLVTLFFSGILGTASVSERLQLSAKAISSIINYPFFGIGFGNFPLLQNSVIFSNFFLNYQPVHNIYLLLSTELGLPLVGWTICYLINKHRYYWPKIVPALGYSFISILALGMVDHYWITSHQNILLIVFLSVLISVKSESINYAK